MLINLFVVDMAEASVGLIEITEDDDLSADGAPLTPAQLQAHRLGQKRSPVWAFFSENADRSKKD